MKEKDILKNADKMIEAFDVHVSGCDCTKCFYGGDNTCMFDMLQDYHELIKALKKENKVLKKRMEKLDDYIDKQDDYICELEMEYFRKNE